jgi:hypothetical protein
MLREQGGMSEFVADILSWSVRVMSLAVIVAGTLILLNARKKEPG